MRSLFALLEKLPHDYDIPYGKNERAHSFHCKRCEIERNLTTLKDRVRWFSREVEEMIGIRIFGVPNVLTKPTPEQAKRVEQWLDARVNAILQGERSPLPPDEISKDVLAGVDFGELFIAHGFTADGCTIGPNFNEVNQKQCNEKILGQGRGA